MEESMPNISRRTAIRSGSALGAAGLFGVGALWYGSQPVLAIESTSWVAEQETVEIDTVDGTIDEIRIDPVVDIQWENAPLQDNPRISTVVRVAGEEEAGDGLPPRVIDTNFDIEDHAGEETGWLADQDFDVLDEDEMRDDPVDDEQFFAADGESETTELTVHISVTVFNGSERIVRVELEDSVAITVNNVESELGVDGSFSTTIDSETAVSDDE